MRVESLSRGPNLPQRPASQGRAPWGRDARESAIAYLAAQARWPGANLSERMAGVENEVDSMTVAERVFLEVEMRERSTRLHSYDYDPCAWGRS